MNWTNSTLPAIQNIYLYSKPVNTIPVEKSWTPYLRFSKQERNSADWTQFWTSPTNLIGIFRKNNPLKHPRQRVKVEVSYCSKRRTNKFGTSVNRRENTGGINWLYTTFVTIFIIGKKWIKSLVPKQYLFIIA